MLNKHVNRCSLFTNNITLQRLKQFCIFKRTFALTTHETVHTDTGISPWIKIQYLDGMIYTTAIVTVTEDIILAINMVMYQGMWSYV